MREAGTPGGQQSPFGSGGNRLERWVSGALKEPAAGEGLAQGRGEVSVPDSVAAGETPICSPWESGLLFSGRPSGPIVKPFPRPSIPK